MASWGEVLKTEPLLAIRMFFRIEAVNPAGVLVVFPAVEDEVTVWDSLPELQEKYPAYRSWAVYWYRPVFEVRGVNR